MDQHVNERLRQLPSISAILSSEEAADVLDRFGRQALTEALRRVVDEARSILHDQAALVPDVSTLLARARARLQQEEQSSLQTVFNLTGTILHTNLGRALLAEEAIAAATATMRDSVALEYDLESGSRGDRDDHVRSLLRELTAAQDATTVNNNAAAVLLCLNTLALGREVIVSRGELIEIGGAFRMPDIMARAGAVMVEVGTTNRTHPRDYREAISPRTSLILKVHTSNYRIQGFTSEVSTAQLAAIAREAQVPLLHDLGSGNLIDLSVHGLKKEPTVREVIARGAQLVTFSGDKLLGGPQSGIIVGQQELIDKIRRNPIRRALRLDKTRLAALEATLKLYRDPERLAQRLPTMRFVTRTRAEIGALAHDLQPTVDRLLGPLFAVEVCECASEIGSGALPLDGLPSVGLSIRPRALRGGDLVGRLAAALRQLPRPVIGRLEEGAVILDLRCLTDPPAFLATLSMLDVSSVLSGSAA